MSKWEAMIESLTRRYGASGNFNRRSMRSDAARWQFRRGRMAALVGVFLLLYIHVSR